MELSELAAYAEAKYHIHEQHKWADFPGFSVLADPFTGKWAALLMRLRDALTGEEVQRCDLKCGQQSLSEFNVPYLTFPFRMKGQKWAGVIFNESTDPQIVFRLFDRAFHSGDQRGYTFILENPVRNSAAAWQDTPLLFPVNPYVEKEAEIPERIRRMMKMYRYGDNTFEQKCHNFYRQGKYMEDYEDSVPYTGRFVHYFPTYHDLDVNQLRGYFTWRTAVRQGKYSRIPISMAYIYIYELLSGIGTTSPEDGLQKMLKFETGFANTAAGDPGMRRNLRRWMLEYAVLHNLPPETAASFADPAILEKDANLAVLKDPSQHTDDEIFQALSYFSDRKPDTSSAVIVNENRGKRLFASVWRKLSEQFSKEGKDIFTVCFGERKAFPWHPLSNAVYWDAYPLPETNYELNECRAYRCRRGILQEERYENLYFDKAFFQSLIHGADRIFRKVFRTGHYLRERPDETWIIPYAEAAVEDEKRAEAEAARPVITVDLSGLDRIRRDAQITRDSLLTEEEKAETTDMVQSEEPPQTHKEESVIIDGLYPQHLRILSALFHGENAAELVKSVHLPASVITDTINEALFDEIGDNVLECEGDTITVVEDYREDVIRLLGGTGNER